MKKSYDAFLSYASENEKMAAEIVGALKSKGLSIWYAPLQLLPGDGLLQSIRQGMELSKCGILLISEIYLNKKWPVFEINELLNGYIGGKKRLSPSIKKNFQNIYSKIIRFWLTFFQSTLMINSLKYAKA